MTVSRKLHVVFVLSGDGPERTVRAALNVTMGPPPAELTAEALVRFEVQALEEVRKTNPKVERAILTTWRWLDG